MLSARYSAYVFFLVALLLVLIGLNVFTILTGRSFMAVIDGISMEPILNSGDIVFLLPVSSPEDIKVGDIIVYRSAYNRLIIHRVVDIIEVSGEYYFVTKGDNNRFPDPPVRPGDPGIGYSFVVGKVISINGYVVKVPYFGYLTLLTRS